MKNCLVLVLLDAGILVLLCNGTLSTVQSERKVFEVLYSWLYANNSVWNTAKNKNKSFTGPVVLLVAYCKDSICA